MTQTIQHTPQGSSGNSLSDDLPDKRTENEGKVQQISRTYFDEFSAPDPLVNTILTAEFAGVVKNGLLIPAAVINPASSAAIGIGSATGGCYVFAGLIMVIAGKILLPSCYTDFKNALKTTSFDEKWRSSLNLLDKCLLISIGVASCLIGVTTILIAAGTVLALASSVVAIASIVFAVLVTIRGLEMMMRGGYGLWKANQFRKDFLVHCRQGDLREWLRQEKDRDAAALKNRIGQTAFDAFNTAESQGNFNAEKLKELVHIGLCEERVKQQLILSIGTVMFVGGALSLVAIGLSQGTVAPLVVTALGIAGSAFSLSMEALWMPYDNPNWFKKLAHWSYRKHKEETSLL